MLLMDCILTFKLSIEAIDAMGINAEDIENFDENTDISSIMTTALADYSIQAAWV